MVDGKQGFEILGIHSSLKSGPCALCVTLHPVDRFVRSHRFKPISGGSDLGNLRET